MRCLTHERTLPDFLPGEFALERGSAADYHPLSSFHYAAGPPATWARVWVVRFLPHPLHPRPCVGLDRSNAPARTVAVGVLSYPVPSCRARERWFKLRGDRDHKLAFANAHLRTISRVIVHPQFRSLGLSTLLVRRLCDDCDTRFIEAIAQMGHIHPLFTRAGMMRTNLDHPEEPAHFVLDRGPTRTAHPKGELSDVRFPFCQSPRAA